MKADEARRWMAYAKSDLDAANTLLESKDFFTRQVCFFAQQAGEKALRECLNIHHEGHEGAQGLEKTRKNLSKSVQSVADSCQVSISTGFQWNFKTLSEGDKEPRKMMIED